MLSKPLRAAVLAGALSLVALAGPVAAASATVESSRITSPADPTNVFDDMTLLPAENTFTVTGTTTGEGKIELRCYYYEPGISSYNPVSEEVEPSGHAFSVSVKASSLNIDQPCVLRAVPAGDKNAHPPGEAGDPFQGPRIATSTFKLSKNSAEVPYDYELTSNDLASYMSFESVGDCGLGYSNLVASATLEESEGLFHCNAALFEENSPPSGPSTRSDLLIDGTDTYTPGTAHSIAEGIEKELKVAIPGVPRVAVTQHFEPLTGLVTIQEVDPIVKCSPGAAVFPPTKTSCTEFVSAGVQLERTWQTSAAGKVALMTDTWRSTDGATHSLDALYNQGFEQQLFTKEKVAAPSSSRVPRRSRPLPRGRC